MGVRLETPEPATLVVHGELDVASVPEALRRAEVLFRAGLPERVDLAGVTRADSAGVALLVEWLRLARQQGRSLRFVHIPAQMRALIQVSDLEDLLGG